MSTVKQLLFEREIKALKYTIFARIFILSMLFSGSLVLSETNLGRIFTAIVTIFSAVVSGIFYLQVRKKNGFQRLVMRELFSTLLLLP